MPKKGKQNTYYCLGGTNVLLQVLVVFYRE